MSDLTHLETFLTASPMNIDGDKLFRTSGRWALASDGIQWVLLKRHGQTRWDGVSYVPLDQRHPRPLHALSGSPSRSRMASSAGVPFSRMQRARMHGRRVEAGRSASRS
jgi:hypothetical protein